MTRRITYIMAVAALIFIGCSDQDTPLASSEEGPKIIAVSPSPSENYVAVDQLFIVEFSEAMNPLSVEVNFDVSIAQKTIAGRYNWNDDETMVTFQPSGPLPTNVEVQVNFGPGMLSRRGQLLVGSAGQPADAFSYSCLSYGYPTSFSSNGERIFFTGTSTSGDPITFSMHYDDNPDYMPFSDTMPYSRGMMGSGMMGNWGGNTWSGRGGMTCASCHGPDGRGNRYLAMGQVVTPDIRYTTLSAIETDTDHIEEEEENEHGHIPYDEVSVRRAITQGIEPDGEPLNAFMPRWSISDRDLDDLIAFLKIL